MAVDSARCICGVVEEAAGFPNASGHAAIDATYVCESVMFGHNNVPSNGDGHSFECHIDHDGEEERQSSVAQHFPAGHFRTHAIRSVAAWPYNYTAGDFACSTRQAC